MARGKLLTELALAAGLAVGLSAAAPALAQTAVIVNPKNPVASLSAEQAAQYFLGRSTTLSPLDLAGRSRLRAEFYQKLAGKDPDQVKAIWSKIVFAGRGFPPREYNNSAAIRSAVAADPNAIAYIEQDAVDATVKVVLVLP
jgi:ABC-type phosphate transport system substrate-binding protein